MKLNLINAPLGIDRIAWATNDILMYHSQDERGDSIGLLGWDILLHKELPHKAHQAFAIHQPTKRTALVGDTMVIVTEGFPVTQIIAAHMMTSIPPMSPDSLAWSGDGELLAFVTQRIDYRSVSCSYFALNVLRISDGLSWSVESTSNFTNVSLGHHGPVAFQLQGTSEVRILEPFGVFSNFRTELRYSYGPKPGQIALLNSDNPKKSSLSIINQEGEPKLHSVYFTDSGDKTPTRLIWSSDGTRFFENPVLGGELRWLAHDLTDNSFVGIVDGDLKPIPESQISCSPDGKRAACMTKQGPAVITFDQPD